MKRCDRLISVHKGQWCSMRNYMCLIYHLLRNLSCLVAHLILLVVLHQYVVENHLLLLIQIAQLYVHWLEVNISSKWCLNCFRKTYACRVIFCLPGFLPLFILSILSLLTFPLCWGYNQRQIEILCPIFLQREPGTDLTMTWCGSLCNTSCPCKLYLQDSTPLSYAACVILIEPQMRLN